AVVQGRGGFGCAGGGQPDVDRKTPGPRRGRPGDHRTGPAAPRKADRGYPQSGRADSSDWRRRFVRGNFGGRGRHGRSRGDGNGRGARRRAYGGCAALSKWKDSGAGGHFEAEWWGAAWEEGGRRHEKEIENGGGGAGETERL